MKAFFRYLRGELNGSYVQNVQNLMNKQIKDIRDFFCVFSSQQFNLEDMDSETIYNLGKFAGVFLPRLSAGEAYGINKMTESHIVNGVERSERGLINRETETFSFVHTENDDYSEDINTLADTDNKSSLVGDEEVQGYISSGATDVINDDGNVDESKVTPEPPENLAYSNYYGNKFSYLSDPIDNYVFSIDISLFEPLFEVMQYIRYNGANLDSLCKVIEILCPDGLVKIQSISKYEGTPCLIIYYVYDEEVALDDKAQRFATMQYVIETKFPQTVLVEVQE